MTFTLCRSFQFDAAHRNLAPDAPEPNARMHGHTYEVSVRVRGELDTDLGWVLDFGDIKSACAPILDALDHRCLNDVEGMAHTDLADVRRWLAARFAGTFAAHVSCDVAILGATRFEPLMEGRVTADPTERLTFGFAAAHFLPRVPADHKCRRLHGHSFGIEIITTDAESVAGVLGDLYPEIDHRLLNEIPGLENPTSEILAQWLWQRIAKSQGTLREISVSETCTTKCIYRGDR